MTPHDLTAESLIAALALQPHPEGGAFCETYRHVEQVTVRGGRAMATAIYFLLRAGERSDWHRVKSDELWFYQGGDALLLKQIDPAGRPEEGWLGLDVRAGQLPQRLIPADSWQAAVPDPAGSHGWTLVSCVVSPGFDFADFELEDEASMCRRFPDCAGHIALVP